jgi:two-component system, cell cycle sensor histidine kinase and response regulator CckA
LVRAANSSSAVAGVNVVHSLGAVSRGVLALAAAAAVVSGQEMTSASGLPVALDAPPKTLDASAGLNRETIYVTERAPDGTLWIGTSIGPRRMLAGRFESVPLPNSVSSPVTRVLFHDSRGVLWAGTHSGLFHRDRSAWVAHGLAEGLPAGRVWSVADWFDDAGKASIAVSIEDVVYVRRAGRFTPLIYTTAKMNAAMLTQTAGPRGRPRLWIASLDGGLFMLDSGGVSAAPASILAELRTQVVEDVRPCEPLGNQAVIVAAFPHVLTYTPESGWVVRRRGAYATRAVCARDASGRPEFWMGGRYGDVVRLNSRGVLQRTMTPESALGNLMQGLSLVQDSAGASAVYVGRFSSWLLRYRSGTATPYPEFGASQWLRDLGLLNHDGTMQLMGVGIRGPQMVWPTRGTATLPAPYPLGRISAAPGGRFLLASATDGTLRMFERGKWRTIPAPVPITRGVHFATWGNPADPARVIMTSGTAIVDFDGTSWSRWPSATSAAILATAADSASGILWTMQRDGLQGIRVRGDTFPRIILDRAAQMLQETVALAVVPRPNGTGSLLVAGSPAGLHIGISDASLRSPRTWTRPYVALPIEAEVTTLSTVGDGTVLLGTSRGVWHFRVNNSPDVAPTLVAAFSRADGLPGDYVHAVAVAPDRDSAFVATTAGLASISLGRPAPPAPTRVLLSVVADVDSLMPVVAGQRLPARTRALVVTASMRGEHREDETLYRAELTQNGKTTSIEWQPDPRMQFQPLTDGRYSLRVFARDWIGRVTPPAVFTFSIDPVFWRSPVALLSYLGLGAALVTMLFRRRTAVASARHQKERTEGERIAASERRFRELFHAAADPQLLTDGVLISAVNAPAERLLGSAVSGELVGQRADGVLSDFVSDSLPTGEREAEVMSLTGERIPVLVRQNRLALDDGYLLHFQLRDLRESRRLESERTMLEEQLRASQRLESLGTLAGGVAHDFNNLLTIIRGNTELALDSLDAQDPRGARESLSAMTDASDRAGDIVRQILLFSQRGTTQTSRVNIAALVTDAQTLLRASMPRSIQLLVDVRETEAWVDADRTQMQQLVLNLCSNAEYAMRNNSIGMLRVTVDTTAIDTPSPQHPRLPVGPYVRLRVTDSGIGMSAEVKSRIFEPFFTTKPVGHGTGLGLSVLHGIVLGHGGSVHVHSVQGRGSEFEVMLPLRSAPERVPGAESDGSVSASSHGIRATPTRAASVVSKSAPLLLLVDDEAPILRAAERALQSLGYRILTAPMGETALALLAGYPEIAGIVTDYSMPGMTGVELAEAVRASGNRIPIVLATGFVARVPEAAARAAGIARIIEKPYTLEQLGATVRAFIPLPEAGEWADASTERSVVEQRVDA